MRPPFFFFAPRTKKKKSHFQVPKITPRCTSEAARIPKRHNKRQTRMQPLRRSASPASSASLVAAFVTYLHSPFPLEVASHHPPFRHDSVGREHFRPVEHTRNN